MVAFVVGPPLWTCYTLCFLSSSSPPPEGEHRLGRNVGRYDPYDGGIDPESASRRIQAKRIEENPERLLADSVMAVPDLRPLSLCPTWSSTFAPGTGAVESVLPSSGFDLINHCCRQVSILGLRYRDSSAVELLLADVLLEGVSVLLCHRGVQSTESKYALWDRSRRDCLARAARFSSSAQAHDFRRYTAYPEN